MEPDNTQNTSIIEEEIIFKEEPNVKFEFVDCNSTSEETTSEETNKCKNMKTKNACKTNKVNKKGKHTERNRSNSFTCTIITMSSCKRKSFSLEEKINIIKEVESGKKKKSEICREKKIPSSTLSTILKNKEKILSAGSSFSTKSKKLRTASNKELDNAMFKWLSVTKAANVPISGPMLQEKAKQISRELGVGNVNFKASNGWISRFKTRHDITFGKSCGESEIKSVSEDVFDNNWFKIRENYGEDNVFNGNECGLFYKNKGRLTVLVCTNMSGKEKRKLLIIGNTLKAINQLPVITYKFNKKALMTPELFSQELLTWDKQLGNRKILLVVDNCTAHPKVTGLINIKLVFLPSNCTTSVLQPMDQGIIRSLKVHYRRLLVKQILNNVENKNSTPINLLDAVYLIHKAWCLVEVKTIRNGFRRAGWIETEEENEEDSNIPSEEWIKLQDQRELLGINNDVLYDLITIDDPIFPEEVRCVSDDSNFSSDEDESDEEENEQQMIPTKQEVESALKTIRHFIYAQDTVTEEINNYYTSLDIGIDKIISNNFKQEK